MAKTPEQRIIELEAKVKLLEKQKARAEHLAERADKKVIIFDMLVGYGRERIWTSLSRKITRPVIERFKEDQEETIVSTCNLLGLDRQVYLSEPLNLELKNNISHNKLLSCQGYT